LFKKFKGPVLVAANCACVAGEPKAPIPVEPNV